MEESRRSNWLLHTLVLVTVGLGVTVTVLRMFDGPDDFVRDCQELLDTGTPRQALVGPFAVSDSAPDHPERCVVLVGPHPVDADLALTRPPELLNGSDVLGALFGNIPYGVEETGTPGLAGPGATAHFLVDETGVVQQQRIDRSSGYEALDEALLGIGPLASFSPAENEDGPTALWVRMSANVRVNR